MTRHALFLTIADYCDRTLLPLNPAPAWALLQQLDTIGDFHTQVQLPKTQDAAAPSAKDLGQALRHFLLNQAPGQDGLIYISSYSITVDDHLGEQQGFLLPPEGEITRADNNTIISQRHGISLDSLNSLIRKSTFQRLVVLWDCNHHNLGLTQDVIETHLTVFNEKPDYCLMANAMDLTTTAHGSGHFSQAISQRLLPEQADSTGAIRCDRLCQSLNHPPHPPELSPIQVGTSSLAVVTYRSAPTTLPPTPPPTINNLFNISGSTLTNVSASGNIHYTEARKVRSSPPSSTDIDRTSQINQTNQTNQINSANAIDRRTNAAHGKHKKILMLAANPKDTDQLRLGAESREILAGLDRAKYRDQFELIPRFAQRPSDMRRALLDIQPNIVHFSGHGGGSHGLVLENDAGKMQFVQTASLARLFKFFSTTIECVVLNACYSEEQADAIHDHINCVVGMNQAVGDRSAIKFAIGFYDALGAGYPYAAAFEMGLIAIDIDRLKGIDIPRLKLRPPM